MRASSRMVGVRRRDFVAVCRFCAGRGWCSRSVVQRWRAGGWVVRPRSGWQHFLRRAGRTRALDQLQPAGWLGSLCSPRERLSTWESPPRNRQRARRTTLLRRWSTCTFAIMPPPIQTSPYWPSTRFKRCVDHDDCISPYNSCCSGLGPPQRHDPSREWSMRLPVAPRHGSRSSLLLEG